MSVKSERKKVAKEEAIKRSFQQLQEANRQLEETRIGSASELLDLLFNGQTVMFPRVMSTDERIGYQRYVSCLAGKSVPLNTVIEDGQTLFWC